MFSYNEPVCVRSYSQATNKNIVDLFRQTFSTIDSSPKTGSTSPRSIQVLKIKRVNGNVKGEGRMSTPPKRHLPDIRYSLSPSPKHGRGDKRGVYGSTGDVTALSREQVEKTVNSTMDINNNSDPKKTDNLTENKDNTSGPSDSVTIGISNVATNPPSFEVSETNSGIPVIVEDDNTNDAPDTNRDSEEESPENVKTNPVVLTGVKDIKKALLLGMNVNLAPAMSAKSDPGIVKNLLDADNDLDTRKPVPHKCSSESCPVDRRELSCLEIEILKNREVKECVNDETNTETKRQNSENDDCEEANVESKHEEGHYDSGFDGAGTVKLDELADTSSISDDKLISQSQENKIAYTVNENEKKCRTLTDVLREQRRSNPVLADANKKNEVNENGEDNDSRVADLSEINIDDNLQTMIIHDSEPSQDNQVVPTDLFEEDGRVDCVMDMLIDKGQVDEYEAATNVDNRSDSQKSMPETCSSKNLYSDEVRPDAHKPQNKDSESSTECKSCLCSSLMCNKTNCQNNKKEPQDENSKVKSSIFDLEDLGAVGGSYPMDKATKVENEYTTPLTEQQISPEHDKPHGILHRKNSATRKTSSVQFSNDVSIETFSQTDAVSDHSSKTELAQGDGPSPSPSLGPLGPLLIPISNTSTQSNWTAPENRPSAKVSSKSLSNSSKGKKGKIKKGSNVISKDQTLHRQGSIPKVLSPTEILRHKQKTVTDKIMQSMNYKASSSESADPDDDISDEDDDDDDELVEYSASENLAEEFKQFQVEQKLQSNSPQNKDKVHISKSKIVSPKLITLPQPKSLDKIIDRNEKVSKSIHNIDTHDTKYVSNFNWQFKDNTVGDKATDGSQKQETPVFQTEKVELGSFSYTTPSKLIQKIDNRKVGEENNQGLGTFSYTSPSKLLQKIEDREKTEQANQGVGEFSYTSPSKLLQKINQSEKTENTNQGIGEFSYTSPSQLLMKTEKIMEGDKNQALGTLSYTSPSKLLQKVEDREKGEQANQGVGSLSYTSPSQLLQMRDKMDSFEKSNQLSNTSSYTMSKTDDDQNKQGKGKKDEPGYWIFKQTSSNIGPQFETALASPPAIIGELDYEMKHQVSLNSKEKEKARPLAELQQYTKEETLDMSEVERIKERDRKFKERCKRKQRLDSMEWAHQRSMSNVSSHKRSMSNVSSQASEEVNTLNKIDDANNAYKDTAKTEHIEDDDLLWNEILSESQCEISAANQVIKQCPDPIMYMNSLLSNFLSMIKEKRAKGESITFNDYQEMDLIQKTIGEISKRIVVNHAGMEKRKHFDDIIDKYPNPVLYMNSLLSSFLAMIQEKRSKGEPITYDDYKEMELIQKTIQEIEMRIALKTSGLEQKSNELVQGKGKEINKEKVKENFYRLGHMQEDMDGKDKGNYDSRETIGSGYIPDHESSDEDQDDKQQSNHFTDKDEKFNVNAKTQRKESDLSGYQGDRSSSDMSLNKKYSNINGWLFSERFLQETSPYNSQHSFGKYPVDYQDSWSVGDEFSSSSMTIPIYSDSDWSVADRQSQISLQDYEEFKDLWHQFNSSDRHTSNAKSRNENQNDLHAASSSYTGNYQDGVTSTESIAGTPYARGTPYPSHLRLTRNPSFGGLSDSEYENDVRNDVNGNEDDLQKDMDSLEANAESTKSDVSSESVETSPRLIRWSTCVSFPEDSTSVQVDLGPSRFTVNSEDGFIDGGDLNIAPKSRVVYKEGSPDRGHKLYGSAQNLDRRALDSGGKRKQAGRNMTQDSRSFMMEKEVTESQNRKLQMEVSTLQTENKLLKEKYNRSQARISDLERELTDAQEDLTMIQENLDQEVSDLSNRTRHEINRGHEELERKIMVLTQENETLKAEVSSLEKQLDSSHRVTDMARHNSEKTRTLQAHKAEIAILKEELNRVKALLEQSERHLREEEDRHSNASKQVLKLTELKNALQQQSDTGGGGTATDKQLRSLEKRLKVTEERLHHERSDRANNLSAVEDKLLTENARLQAVEKDLIRQLHREKEKNRNFDNRVKQIREENEKLRLAMPFDDTTLLSNKESYDIPYSNHSNQRAETMKHISDDMNYILSQIEKQDGLPQGTQEEEVIRVIWNKRELAYKQLHEYDLHFQELRLSDNNFVDGLKNLRDTYGQAESKLKCMEEEVEDARAKIISLDSTYKQQLSQLVHERHEGFARLKTAEDLLEAVRTENEMLRRNVGDTQTSGVARYTADTGAGSESLRVENAGLESRLAQVTRNNQLIEGELRTAKVQIDARNKQLQDVQSELDLAYSRLQGEEAEDKKQQKIDKLQSQLSSVQVEMKLWQDKYNSLVTEKSKLDSEMMSLRKTSGTQKLRHQKTDNADSKVVQQLHEELAEKDSKLNSVSKQLDDVDQQLQKTRQELYIEQMHTEELETEVEIHQQTASQRAQMFESLSGTEREQLAQYQILKDTLDNISQELAQKHAQIISLDVNLSSQKDRTAELEEELQKLRRIKAESNDDVTFTEDEQSSAHQLKINELEKERTQLKNELVQAYSAIQASEEQYRTLQTESAQLEQELVKEKTVILQITAEKGEIEAHLEELAEEHDSLIQEKSQSEDDLIKLETKLQEILQKYETEARKQHGNFEKQYPNMPNEARQLVSEIDSLRLMLEGKDREINMLQDKIHRQQIEMDFYHRKVELVHSDSISNREDVARMISELTLKMKEAVSTREVNQFLVGERTKLQNEKCHLELELEQERKHNDQRKKEIADVIHKIERTETHQKSAEKSSRDKENTISSLDMELRTSKQTLSSLETENCQMKNRLEHLNKDLGNLTTINATLDQRLDMEKNSLLEEKNAASKWKEDSNCLSHDLEVLRHDHAILCDKYNNELQNVDKLRRDVETLQSDNTCLQEELRNTKHDLDSQKGQLLITKDTVQKLNQDKGSIYQDYEGMCRTLTDKDRQLTEYRERTTEQIEQMKKEHVQDRARLEQDRAAAIQDRDLNRKEMDVINEQLKQKEIQLSTFGKTLQELEAVTRQKKELEAHLHQLEYSSGDSRVLLEGQRKELMALNESLAKQQEKMTRFQAENHTLQAELKSQKDCGGQEIRELKLTVQELKSQHENERSYLNDNLAQTQTHLRGVETSLASAANDRDTLQAQKCLQDKALEDCKAQLSDECTGRRLAEQSVGQLRLQLEDARNEKNVGEAKLVEWKNQLTKAEGSLKSEQDRNHKLQARVQELAAVSHTTESNVRARGEQLETLQKEISKLKQMLETQKLSFTGKLKKASLEFKQQLDIVQADKDKLQMNVQQLSTDLDLCREQIAKKNKENLKLQEEMLVLEDSVRESKSRQKKTQETLKMEADRQTELDARNKKAKRKIAETFSNDSEEEDDVGGRGKDGIGRGRRGMNGIGRGGRGKDGIGRGGRGKDGIGRGGRGKDGIGRGGRGKDGIGRGGRGKDGIGRGGRGKDGIGRGGRGKGGMTNVLQAEIVNVIPNTSIPMLNDERFREQDEELKRLRNFLAKKVEESGDADKSMWHEMNRVIQELSTQMHNHLDAQRNGDPRGKSSDGQVLRTKKQLAEVQGELSTEKSLHQITKSSLQALEEDCQRLRQQMRSLRRRDNPGSEKKYKSRAEAINAIIARSQTNAQAMLASGGYYDDAMASPRLLLQQSPRVGFHSPLRPESPDNSYSEDLSIASLPPLHYGSSSKK